MRAVRAFWRSVLQFVRIRTGAKMNTEGNALVRKLAFWGIPLSFGVLGLKLVAWWVTGSVALLSDGLESTVNVVAAFIAYFVIRYAQKPADDDHQFGHHKAEYISAVVEGVLIVVAALLIVQEARVVSSTRSCRKRRFSVLPSTRQRASSTPSGRQSSSASAGNTLHQPSRRMVIISCRMS